MAEATVVFTGTRAKSPGWKTDWTALHTVDEGTRAANIKEDEDEDCEDGGAAFGVVLAGVDEPSEPHPSRRVTARKTCIKERGRVTGIWSGILCKPDAAKVSFYSARFK